MTIPAKPSVSTIRQSRIDNPRMRERDLAAELGISEAELVAAFCGEGAIRLEPRVNELLQGLEAVGEVMALTRNESAVHEKIGVYEEIFTGRNTAMALGKDIDLRIFPPVWASGFAVEKRDGTDVRRSLQFFDAAGMAVHKIHLRAGSDVAAYEALVQSLRHGDQSAELPVTPLAVAATVSDEPVDAAALRERWAGMTDPHQFVGLLRSFRLDRRNALDLVGEDYAWQIDPGALHTMFAHAVEQGFPLMCFVGNRGCIQIHSGPIFNIKPMGPWINVMDSTFHLHLRTDHVVELWVVRKPTKEGHVTSIEAYDGDGELIIQFFGKRNEGEDERADWRLIAEKLPRFPRTVAA